MVCWRGATGEFWVSRLFDPRALPLVPVGTEPVLPPHLLTPAGLRWRFAKALDWQTEESTPFAPAVQPVEAAVLLAITTGVQPSVVLTRRSKHLPVHAGQVALPGGKRDPQDTDVVATALREAREEVGLDPSEVQVLGCLPPHATGTGFVVTPVVGLLPASVTFQPHWGEVEQVFEVPLAFLMDPQHHFRQSVEVDGHIRSWYAMPYATGGDEFYIWGATAGMLRTLYCFLRT